MNTDKPGVVIVITRNNPMKLRNVIDSLLRNQDTMRLPTIVIDDSTDSVKRKANAEALHHFDKNFTYVDKHNLEAIKKLLKKSYLKRHHAILDSFELGKKNWNTDNSRNVGQLVALLLYGKDSFGFNLDEDMVIKPDLNITRLSFSRLCGFQLDGCPDLSRMEWIQFFLRNLSNKSKSHQYVDVLTNKLTKRERNVLLAKYTTFFPRTSNNLSPRFPVREELNGGCFLSRNLNAKNYPFPNWFNEDWLWFYNVRGRSMRSKFAPCSIIHASSKKNCLNVKDLFREEVGIILTYAYKNCSQELSKEVECRQKVIQQELNNIDTLLSENKAKSYRKTLVKLRKVLSELLNRMSYINRTYARMLRSYNMRVRQWRRLTTDLNKVVLRYDDRLFYFNSLGNLKAILISPHPDDVALSIGGAIQRGFFSSPELETFFNRSNYTKKGIGNILEVTKARRNEEKIAAAKMGAKLRIHNLDDAIIRPECKGAYIAQKNVSSHIYRALKHKFKKIVGNYKKRVYVFPLALGKHIDHILLNRIGMNLAKKNFPVLFYEDIGYRDATMNKIIWKKAREVNARPFVAKSDISTKMNLVMTYKSQINESLRSMVKSAHKEKKGERIWIPRK